MYVSLAYELWEELQEEGYHEQTDVHTVDIGIGSHNDLVVTESVDAVLDVECSLQEIELLVLVHHFLCQSERVERFASQREHGLRVDVAALSDASASRVTLSDEDAALLLAVALSVIEVYAAVAQLAVVQVSLLCTLSRQLSHSGYSLAVALVLLYLLLDSLSYIGVLMQEVVHLVLDEVAHKLVDADSAVRLHRERAELNLCLALKLRFFDVDSNGCNDTCTDVAILIVLVVELLDSTCNVLLEGALVRTSLYGVLSVDERMVLLAVLLIGMRESNLYVVSLEMDDRIERLRGHGVGQEVLQTVARHDAAAVIVDFESGVEVCVVAQHSLDELCSELIVEEQGAVGLEIYVCAVLFG